MENQRLYELAVSLSERTDESLESCVQSIQNVIQNSAILIQNAVDALKEIIEGIAHCWQVIKDTINLFEENEAKRGWFLDWDMRKKSQVINNRPSYLVRKIIR